MKPSLYKQFMLEAYDYNASLPEPFDIIYVHSTEYYSKFHYFKFRNNETLGYNEFLIQEKSHPNYSSILERDLKEQSANPNAKQLILIGDTDFMHAYFNHFFNQHKELQLDLLKFYTGFVKFSSTQLDFLNTLEKKEIEPFLLQINSWYTYSNESLKNLNTLMTNKNFNEGFKVGIIKKYVEYNLKAINKNPSFSKGLEEFVDNHYPNFMDIITPNVVAIQKRIEPVDQTTYFSSFKNSICLYQHIDSEKLLKTFHIAGWTTSSYNSLVQMYHLYLSENKKFNIKADIHQNQKSIEVYIKTPNSDYTLEKYQQDLLFLFNFYRQNPEHRLLIDNVSKILFNQKLQDNLPPKDCLHIKPKKI